MFNKLSNRQVRPEHNLFLRAKDDCPMIVAHRGANDEAPENTWPALCRCVELGVDVVELDIRFSRNSVPYSFHDPILNRTTNGTGAFRLRSSRYIDRLDAGTWFSEEFAGERIPKVEEIFAELGHQVSFYLDVKNGSLQQLQQLIRKHGMVNRVFVWFARARRARRFRRLAPDIPLKLNIDDPQQLYHRVLPVGATLVEVELERLSEELVDACRSAGVALMARCGAPDPEAYRQCNELGVDLINLDHPALYIRSFGNALSTPEVD